MSEKIEEVPLDAITVPQERVTSVWDPAIEEEFAESVKSKGILEPIVLMRIGEDLYLIDGLHRVQIAERLGMKTLKAIVREGTVEDLLLENIIRNRQRGKSNPAQEAEVLEVLVEKRRIPLETAAATMGMSLSWAKKLLKIARLPSEVKDYVKHGKIGVGSAFHISMLGDPVQAVEVAADAAKYKYTEEQTKYRVLALLKEGFEAPPGGVTFTPEGVPSVVPMRCFGCGHDLPKEAKYLWICEECLKLATHFFQVYWAPEPETPVQKPVQPVQPVQPAQPQPGQGP